MCIVRLLCSAVCLQGSVGKVETVDNAGDDDESAAKRLKSDDADKTDEAATNEQWLTKQTTWHTVCDGKSSFNHEPSQ